MEYTLLINDLALTGEHGLLKEEHLHDQTFVINSEVTCLFRELLAVEDKFDELACYGNVRDSIVGVFEGRRYDTLEAMALAINTSILSLNNNFNSVTTSIVKVQIFSDCKVGVRLTNKRHVK